MVCIDRRMFTVLEVLFHDAAPSSPGGVDGGVGFIIMATTSGPQPHGAVHNGPSVAAPSGILRMFSCHCLHIKKALCTSEIEQFEP